jgi:non-ribosomal peptide synthetase component F
MLLGSMGRDDMSPSGLQWQAPSVSDGPGGDMSGIHELFERQVGLTPNAPAIRFRDQRLTYAELDSAADLVASV